MFAENFLEGQWGSLCEKFEDLEEELAKVELSAPGGVVLPCGPIRYEVVLNPIVLLNIIEKLNYRRIFRLVEVDIGRYDRILRG